MKTFHLFHPNTCCLTDCLVRYCTCGVAGVPGPDASDEDEALEHAATIDLAPDGRVIEFLSGRVDTVGDVFHVHFMTSSSESDDGADAPHQEKTPCAVLTPS